MAEVIWGLATSHVPSIGAAMDRGKTEDPNWKALFDGYAPARAWLAEHTPDVAIVVYNDHANGIDLDFVPLLVDVDVLVVVPATLLCPAPLLPGRHGELA